MADTPPPLPATLSEEVRVMAERVEDLTCEMLAGKEVDDWGRVTRAEEEQRPLVRRLVEAGFQREGGEAADEWLRWFLATQNEIIERGQAIREEMLEELRRTSDGQRAARAYERHRG